MNLWYGDAGGQCSYILLPSGGFLQCPDLGDQDWTARRRSGSRYPRLEEMLRKREDMGRAFLRPEWPCWRERKTGNFGDRFPRQLEKSDPVFSTKSFQNIRVLSRYYTIQYLIQKVLYVSLLFTNTSWLSPVDLAVENSFPGDAPLRLRLIGMESKFFPFHLPPCTPPF